MNARVTPRPPVSSRVGYLHPAYAVIGKAELAWSDNLAQANTRAIVIVAALALSGLLPDGEWFGERWCLKEPLKSNGERT